MSDYDRPITRKKSTAPMDNISEGSKHFPFKVTDAVEEAATETEAKASISTGTQSLDCVPQPQAKRYNKGKPRPSLLPPEWTEELMTVLEKGAEKYDANNWKIGLPFVEVLDSLERHLLDFKKGIDIDPDDGLPVLSKIAVNALFLRYYQLKGKTEFDNRKEWYERSNG